MMFLKVLLKKRQNLDSSTIEKKSRGGNALSLRRDSGFSLLELMITITVLSIMVFTAVPLAQNAVQRQKEEELRAALRQIRTAIDQFKLDTLGACPQGAITTVDRTGGNNAGSSNLPNVPSDPRTRVVIDDCKIFEAENLDRYPPTLETLVEGVTVKSRSPNIGGNGAFDDKTVVFSDAPKDLKKVYLREIPIDPMTGKADWILRSSYQGKDSETWDDINVFDVRSASGGEALNGEKYSDW